jgi:type IV fimbrial biogenesis protein FimT
MNKAHGFTLIELLVTIAVGAILLMVAVPNYITFVLNGRMAAQSNDFLSALQLARSEAVKRGFPVSVCKSADSATCTAAGTWAQGYIVSTGGPNGLIRAFPALSGNSTLVGDANVPNVVTYQLTGNTTLAAGTNAVVSLCPIAPAGVAGRDIQISASGRARVKNPPAAACP